MMTGQGECSVGKVTIIVEAGSMSTGQLYAMLMANDDIGEEALKAKVHDEIGSTPEDLRVYVVPSDD
jgi:hypothetical protein